MCDALGRFVMTCDKHSVETFQGSVAPSDTKVKAHGGILLHQVEVSREASRVSPVNNLALTEGA